jgi:hypothetical protein
MLNGAGGFEGSVNKPTPPSIIFALAAFVRLGRLSWRLFSFKVPAHFWDMQPGVLQNDANDSEQAVTEEYVVLFFLDAAVTIVD